MDDSLDNYPKPFSLNFVDDDDDVNSLFEKINPATQEPLSQADFEFEDNFNEDESRTGVIFYYSCQNLLVVIREQDRRKFDYLQHIKKTKIFTIYLLKN